MKYLKWIAKSLLFGVISLLVFNFLGVYVNLNIPVNIYTILIISVLRLPGLCMLIILMNFM